MLEHLIPEYIDPYHLAEKNICLHGLVPLGKMQRLASSLYANDGHAIVDLQFGVDEQRVIFLRGCLTTHLFLQCQRCMESFLHTIASNFVLGIVNTLSEADALPTQYEPVMVKAGNLMVWEVVEEELILSLPIIPRHQPGECTVTLPLTDAEWAQSDHDNPFQVLASLKCQQKK